MPDVHWCVTVDYQQIVDSNIARLYYRFLSAERTPAFTEQSSEIDFR